MNAFRKTLSSNSCQWKWKALQHPSIRLHVNESVRVSWLNRLHIITDTTIMRSPVITPMLNMCLPLLIHHCLSCISGCTDLHRKSRSLRKKIKQPDWQVNVWHYDKWPIRVHVDKRCHYEVERFGLLWYLPDLHSVMVNLLLLIQRGRGLLAAAFHSFMPADWSLSGWNTMIGGWGYSLKCLIYDNSASQQEVSKLHKICLTYIPKYS